MNNFKNLVQLYNDKKNAIKILAIKKLEVLELYDNFLVSNKNSNHSDIVNQKIKKIDEENLLLEKELNIIRNSIIDCVSKLNNDVMQNIILLRIFTQKTWNYIAKISMYSEARVRQLYKQGISTLQINIQ